MKEKLVNNEIAKLAFEKGFNHSCENAVYKVVNTGTEIDGDVRTYGGSAVYKFLGFKPSQSILQKWLREAHEIHIVSKPFYDSIHDKTTYVSDVLSKNYPRRINKSPRCDTYEEALEYALEKALNMIE